ncbi:MAG TPA: hypothetical protein VFY87_02965 [Geminicoccaceae bacterium]|nr:hypothetical protein [Geminicoccaceae bacterium]
MVLHGEHGLSRLGVSRRGVLDSVDCLSWGPGRLDCFAKSTYGTMWQRSFQGGAWGNWVGHYGPTIIGKPECVSWGPNRIDCFAEGEDGALWHIWRDGVASGG